jgi:adenine-specific DNA-methyltransferase
MPTLHWLTRSDDLRATNAVPYRLLEGQSELGYGDHNTSNMLIQGDNLDALKALLPFYAGQVNLTESFGRSHRGEESNI